MVPEEAEAEHSEPEERPETDRTEQSGAEPAEEEPEELEVPEERKSAALRSGPVACSSQADPAAEPEERTAGARR